MSIQKGKIKSKTIAMLNLKVIRAEDMYKQES